MALQSLVANGPAIRTWDKHIFEDLNPYSDPDAEDSSPDFSYVMVPVQMKNAPITPFEKAKVNKKSKTLMIHSQTPGSGQRICYFPF